MPQLSPMNWLFLFFFFSSGLMVLQVKLHFFFYGSKSSNSFSVNKPNYEFKL